MASSGNNRASAETILERLAKRPILLIILTASISFGVQQIPFSTITSTVKFFWDASVYQFKLSNFKESLHQLLRPSLLLAFVCSGVLFIAFTSHQDKGEYRTDDQFQNLTELRRGLLTRTATLGQTVFSHLIPQTNDARLYLAKQGSGCFDQDTAEAEARSSVSSKQEDAEIVSMSPSHSSVTSRSVETRTAKRMATKNLKTSVGIAGSKAKLSRPKTADFSSENRPTADPKLSYSPRSFGVDPAKLDKEELKGRSEAYLGNFRRQLQLQQQESLLAKQLNLELKQVKLDSKQTVEASSVVATGLLNDQEMGPKSKASATMKTENDLSEEEIRERTDAFLASMDRGSRPQREGMKSAQQRNLHLKSYSLSDEEHAESAPKDASAPELLHSTSNPIVRSDSLVIENKKFESFLQRFRNDLKLQKQESNLRKQLLESEF